VKKLWWLYVVLAGVAVVTTLGALLLTVRAIGTLDRSVSASERAMSRNASVDPLDSLLTDVNAPGNSVFETGDIGRESERMTRALAHFRESMAAARRNLLIGLTPPQSRAVLRSLTDVELQVHAVEQEGRAIYSLLSGGNVMESAVHMSRMNRHEALAQQQLAEIEGLIHRFRAEQIGQSRRQVAALFRSEIPIALLVLLVIFGLVVYGGRMLRESVAVEDLYRRQEELRRANIAFEDALSGVSFIDPNGRFAFVSRPVAATLGYEPDEMIGMPTTNTTHPDDQPIIERSNGELRERGKSEIEIRGVRKDGGIVHTRLVRVVSLGENGRYLGHYSFAKDVSEQKRAEEALRKSEERFALAARATNDVIYEWNFKTNECWVSEAWHTTLGNPTWGDIDLTHWKDALHPDDRNRVFDGNRAAITSGENFWSGEYRLRRGDGTYAEVVGHGYIVRDQTGEAVRMVGAVIDVTQQKRAQRRYYTQILNAAADGIVGFDSRGLGVFANEAATRMLSCSLDDLIGRDMHAFLPHGDADREHTSATCPTCTSVMNGVPVTSATEVCHRNDGSTFPIEYSATQTRDVDGKVTGVVITFRDITQRRAVEQMKDEFVSIVSHELRTPLTSIRGALGLIAGGRIGEIPQKAQRMLDIAVSNTDRLVRLINDILDIERIDSGTVSLKLQVCDAQTVMRQAIDLIRPIANKANVEIECGVCDEAVFADPDRLTQVFTNLLGNAIRFSPSGSRVTLNGTHGDHKVLFEVADHGRGIPPEKLELIFERFQQVDASDSRENGGSGLGLAICRSIVREHGGEIWAESVPGSGSRLRFTIPCPDQAKIPAPSGGRTVMVCDEGSSVHELMSTLLKERGYHAVAVGSGAELLRRVQDVAPDVIILDLLMKGLNAFETLAKLKEEEKTAAIPVVIMSVFPQTDSDRPAASLAGWIQKPLEAGTIVNALEQAFDTAMHKQVLLVEDDVDLARVIAAGFDRHGVRTIHVTSGSAAIEEASKFRPDLLILDIGLPDIDGYAVVDWLKDHDMLRSVPVVVYSASEPTPSQRERLTLGPTEFLTKSRIAPEEFERRVIQLLDKVTTAPVEMSHVA
jgi:PAS domain S-box-containing protein